MYDLCAAQSGGNLNSAKPLAFVLYKLYNIRQPPFHKHTNNPRRLTMRIMKQVVVPQRVDTRLDYAICDLCKQPIVQERYIEDSVKIRWRKGAAYPDYYSVTETSVDMCGACFKNKLLPWLQSQDATPTVIEIDN
jgi:hypothetical protein